VNRAHWQALAEERLVAAQALLAAQQWSSAYYLAGYAVEFGLKSCILAHIANTGIVFKEKKFSEQCWTHDLEDLLVLAGLERALSTDRSLDAKLDRFWQTVIKWNESSRYDVRTQSDAEELYEAMANQANGVMSWIRVRW
jgi:HEPN domain-containing protein